MKYRRPYLSSFGQYRMGVRGRYEDRIFALKPFRYLDRFMHCLWDEKWVPGYREERTVKDGLTLHFTVEDGGSITVPAGTFENCRKVTLRLEKPADEDDGWYYRDGYRNMDGGLKEYWFAPGAGIVKTAFTWGTSCYAKGLLSAYHVSASKPGGYLPIQVGNGWEYDEPHLTAEGYRAKAIFRIASVTNGEYLMLSSQKFVFLKTEDEYDAFVKGYAE